MQKISGVSLIGLINKTWKNEGLLGFYKGMAFPLAAIPVINSVIFGTNEVCKLLMHVSSEGEMSNAQNILCGSIAGFTGCFVVTPSELVKVKLQMQFENKQNAKYKGVLDCITQEYRSQGIRGLFTGFVITALRDIPGYAAQFSSYTYSKQLFTKWNDSERRLKIPYIIETLISGGIGGFFCWLVSYPQDTVKTYLQSNSGSGSSKLIFRPRYFDGGIIECSKYIYLNFGHMGFWRGFGVCTIRAFYANAFLFYFFEIPKNLMEKYL